MTAREELGRIARYQQALSEKGLEAALVLPAVDVYYLAGTRQNAALFVPAAGAPVLLVRKSFARARGEAAVADVRPFPPSKDLVATLGAKGKVGLAFDVVPAATVEWWRKVLPGAELVDASAILREQRMVKSTGELAIMREGGRRISAVIGETPSFLRAGMREIDVAAEIEARLRRAGNGGSPRLRTFNSELFVGLAIAGDSAAEPGNFDGPVVGRGVHPAHPGGASRREVRRDEPVLLDYTAMFDGYVLDMTRIAVVGSLSPDLLRAFDLALAIQDEVARGLVPGAVGQELWEKARARADAAGLGASFMGAPGEQVRFVGHGVGLELDELPVLAPGFKAPLAAGMTVAVEPKFVFPGVGAVGIENTWVVTERGGERLTVLPDAIMAV